MHVLALAGGLSLAALAAPSLAASPIGADAPVAGQRTHVMTLGSMHLSEHKAWTAAMLEPLIERLAAFRPDIITHEGVSGEQCEAMRAFPDLYAEAVEQYCWDPATIRARTRMSVAEALHRVREELAGWPAKATPAARRRLAMLFLAAGDRASARVQWLRLAAAERRAGNGIDEAMIATIERKDKPLNESFDVASALAARLGHERVFAVDDHSSDGTLSDAGKPFEEALAAHFGSARDHPTFKAMQARTAKVTDGASLLDYFRELNAPGAQDAQVRADFGGAMAQERPGTPARYYVGWWDVRNLRMAANVRATFVTRPGSRVLNIVGSSHKPWYDALMGIMADVEVVDAAAVLR